MAAGGNRLQDALRQTLGVLHGAAAAGPVQLPGVSFMTMAAASEAPWETGAEEVSGWLLRPGRPAGRVPPTWHGSWAATEGLFGPSAGAEAAAVEGPAVASGPPGHGQRKRRPLQEEEGATPQVCESTPPGGRWG